MDNAAIDRKVDALFDKLDKVESRFIEHDKWAAGTTAKLELEIAHLKTEVAQLREEQRIQQSQLHVNAESSNEERYKLKETLLLNIIKAEETAIKSSNSYTNRGVSIAVGVLVFIFGAVEAIWYVKDMLHSGGH